ncbi:hypothetical protein D770_15775 [Flammeovirgaceae bacterium 311]|nr:hypothetical protein D770_15775 [Flammeovirgaceae bacterium 311]
MVSSVIKNIWLRLIALGMVLLVFSVAVSAQQLYPMRKYDKWGYIDESGRWVIKPQYQMAMDFHDGLAMVKDTYQGGEVWDFINEKGQKVIQSEYFGFGAFIKLYDYKVSVKPHDHFSEGLIPVTIQILDPTYKGAGISGFLNKEGQLEIYGYYDKVYNFSDGLARVEKNGKSGYINRDGDYAIPPIFRGGGTFANGLAPVLDEATGKWGYVDKKGQFVIQPQFSKAREFANGVAAVWKDFKWGYIMPDGSMAVPLQFRSADSFSNGFAFVTTESDAFFIDRHGNKVFDNDLYDKLCHTRSFTNGAALMSVSPENRACNSYRLAEEVILEDTNLLMYLNTDGKIIYRQELEEYYTINKIRRP